MCTASCVLVAWALRVRVPLFVLMGILLIVPAPPVVHAAPPPPSPPAAITSPVPTDSPTATNPLVFAGVLDRVFSFFEANLSSQRRLMQFALVMVLLGLWAIWWRGK